MPKKNRQKVYEYLYSEGVCVAKKDTHAKSHPYIEGVPNLHVIKAMQSLVSRGLVHEQYAWRHYYWVLKDEGVAFLKQKLCLPDDVIPKTHAKAKRADGPTDIRQERRFDGGRYAGADADRSAYRGGDDKTADAGLGAGGVSYGRPGFGRGTRPPAAPGGYQAQ